MGYTPKRGLMSEYDYYEVFNKNKTIRYGITSTSDMQIIKSRYPDTYIFEKIDMCDMYVDLEKLEEKSRYDFLNPDNLTFNQKITIILVLILVICIVICILFPEKSSLIQFNLTR